MKSHRAARKKSPARSHQRGFTPQQIVILILFAVTCTAILAATGYWLFSGGLDAPSASISGQVEPQASVLPPTWTAPAVIETPPAATPAPAQAIPALPAGCAQAGTAFQQGIVRGIIDGSTIEVQDGENILRIGYAGITVTQDLPAAQKARELLEGQPVMLVKDISEQDSTGRLVRYVFSGSRFINFELARQGLATVLVNSPDQACAAFLEQAQQQARVEKLGSWQSTPVPTRTFVPFVTLDPNQAGCDCSVRYLCSDFKTHEEAQTCLNACNDYSSKLDEDRDGIACEDLP